MSTAKHKGYRKILSVHTYNLKIGELTVCCRDVVWCLVGETTSRTVKTGHIGFTTLIGKQHGVEACFPKKRVSINLKNPLESKFFQNFDVERLFKTARSEAAKDYLVASQGELEAKVSWFDKSRGEGFVKIESLDLLIPVYACNIKGKKTWYPETACVFLNKEETVTVKLIDLGHLSCEVLGGSIHFDTEKWNSLDRSKLAFKCDENGKATNGLFS